MYEVSARLHRTNRLSKLQASAEQGYGVDLLIRLNFLCESSNYRYSSVKKQSFCDVGMKTDGILRLMMHCNAYHVDVSYVSSWA